MQSNNKPWGQTTDLQCPTLISVPKTKTGLGVLDYLIKLNLKLGLDFDCAFAVEEAAAAAA